MSEGAAAPSAMHRCTRVWLCGWPAAQPPRARTAKAKPSRDVSSSPVPHLRHPRSKRRNSRRCSWPFFSRQVPKVQTLCASYTLITSGKVKCYVKLRIINKFFCLFFVVWLKKCNFVADICACGGIGRHARLRIWCREACKFESYQAYTPHGKQFKIHNSNLKAESFLR